MRKVHGDAARGGESERLLHPVEVLRRFLDRQTGAQILFVDGLEARPDYLTPDQPGNAVELLSAGREALARLPAVVVFLLPHESVDRLRAHALNLWSWRGHHVTLDGMDGGRWLLDELGGELIAPLQFRYRLPSHEWRGRHAAEREVRIEEQALAFADPKTNLDQHLEHAERLALLRAHLGQYKEAANRLEQTLIAIESALGYSELQSVPRFLGTQALCQLLRGYFSRAGSYAQHAKDVAREDPLLDIERPDFAEWLDALCASALLGSERNFPAWWPHSMIRELTGAQGAEASFSNGAILIILGRVAQFGWRSSHHSQSAPPRERLHRSCRVAGR